MISAKKHSKKVAKKIKKSVFHMISAKNIAKKCQKSVKKSVFHLISTENHAKKFKINGTNFLEKKSGFSHFCERNSQTSKIGKVEHFLTKN